MKNILLENKPLEKIVEERDYYGLGRHLEDNGLSLEDVKEQYGEFSQEYEMYQIYLSENIRKQVEIEPKRSYILPERFSEDPSDHKGMMVYWIKRFHILNHMPLPKGFNKKDKKQVQAMYHGMVEYYSIRREQIIGN